MSTINQDELKLVQQVLTQSQAYMLPGKLLAGSAGLEFAAQVVQDLVDSTPRSAAFDFYRRLEHEIEIAQGYFNEYVEIVELLNRTGSNVSDRPQAEHAYEALEVCLTTINTQLSQNEQAVAEPQTREVYGAGGNAIVKY